MTEPTRAYIYRIILAVLPLAVVYGAVKGDDAPLILTVAQAVLGIGGAALATANTSTDKGR